MNIKLHIKLNGAELNYEGDDSFLREKFQQVLSWLSNPAGGTSARPVVVSPVYVSGDENREGQSDQGGSNNGSPAPAPDISETIVTYNAGA